MKNELCLVACSKFEGNYLKEWIDHHKLLGFEHIYLYDAGGDQSEEICRVYGDFVTYIHWPHYPAQYESYIHFRDNYGTKWNWAAFFDLDEYLVPINYDLKELLRNFDKDYISGVAVGWHIFGHNGYLTSQESIIDAYTKCVDYSIHKERFTKLIMRPMRIKAITDPHWFESIEGTRIVREDFKTLAWGDHHHRSSDSFPVQTLRLNHYFTKSLEDFLVKVERHGPDGKSRVMREFITCNVTANAVTDTLIQNVRRRLKIGS